MSLWPGSQWTVRRSQTHTVCCNYSPENKQTEAVQLFYWTVLIYSETLYSFNSQDCLFVVRNSAHLVTVGTQSLQFGHSLVLFLIQTGLPNLVLHHGPIKCLYFFHELAFNKQKINKRYKGLVKHWYFLNIIINATVYTTLLAASLLLCTLHTLNAEHLVSKWQSSFEGFIASLERLDEWTTYQ